jgi:tRNA A-37 threonylcarbamoyl transferase component Bud32
MHISKALYNKQGESAQAVSRLKHEAAILRTVSHPDVVELINTTVTDNKASLQMTMVDGVPLHDVDVNIETLGKIIASAAGTLAFLHAKNIAHNGINDAHILVRADNTAVLCGFGSSRFALNDYDQTRDVIALASLLISRTKAHADPLRTRINNMIGSQADLAMSLASIADRAIDGHLSAREFGRQINALYEAQPSKTHTHNRTSSRLALKVAAALLIPVFLVVGGVEMASARTRGVSDAGVSTAPPITKRCDSVDSSATAVDTDGDGCPNEVEYGNGIVTVDGQRYAVGVPGDQFLIGDWHGTGLSTLALLRPSTGQIYVYDSWPSSGADTTPQLVATISGASNIVDQRAGHHDVIIATTPSGNETVDPMIGYLATTTTTG